ncbi:MAG: lamin tail domain-containing protein [Bacteroidia bacterium]
MRHFALFSTFFLLIYISETLAQCTTSFRDVVINEITPDPGNYDGQGAEWTELYNQTTTAVDVSHWVLTDGEEIIVFPNATTIPANGYLLIYNGNYFSCTSCNWDPSISSLLSTGTGAVPAIDLATCNCTNQASPAFAVTWDNGGATDRVALFNCNAQIVDAVYWGNGEKEEIPSNPILESSSNYGAAAFLEAAPYNFAPALNWSIPALTDPRWDNTGQDIVGCTTSKSRISDGSSTWISDFYPSPAQTNTTPDYAVRVIIDDDGVAPFLQTKTLTLAELAAGKLAMNVCPNQQVRFEIDIHAYNQVYNDLDGDANNQEGGSPRGGSTVSSTGGINLSKVAWSSETISNGTTSLVYDFTPLPASSVISLIVKENTQGPIVNASTQPGVSSILGSGSASECYIQQIIQLKVINPITAISYTCNNGLLTVTTSPSSNFGTLQINLDNGSDNSLDQSQTVTSTPASFQISAGNSADYSLNAAFVGGDGCGSLPVITGGAICVFSPPCPSALANQACANDPSGSKCPGDVIDLGISGTDLPGGGTIEWVRLDNASDDPYTADKSRVVASVAIGGVSNWFFTNFTSTTDNKSIQRSGNAGGAWVNGSAGSTNTPGAGNAGGNYTGTTIKVNEVLVDGPTNCDGGLITAGATGPGEYIEIAGPPGTDIGCYTLSDGDYTITIPAGTTIPNDGYYLIGNGNASCAPAGLDLNIATCASCFINTNAVNDFTFTNPTASNGEYIGIFDANGYLLDGVVWGAPNNTGGNSPCAGIRSLTRLGGASGCSALTLPIPQPISCANATPPCTSFTLPESACNSTWHIRPRILPVAASCGATPPSLPALSYDVTCPSATITGTRSICPGQSTSLQFDFANVGATPPSPGAPYTLTYSKDGVPQTAVTATTNPFLVTGVNAAGIYNLVSVTDGAGPLCTFVVSGEATITSEPTAAVPSISSPSVSPNNVCAGGPLNIELSTVNLATATVNWYNDAGLTSLEGSNNPFVYTPPTPNTTKTFHVEAVNPDNGCKSVPVSVDLTVANCIFPVELFTFEGKKVADKIQLVWQTTKEINSDYFTVEKSQEGTVFSSMINIPAKGNTNEPTNYQTFDESPFNGDNYYRLKMTDLDGTFQYSDRIRVKADGLANQISFTPNPATNEVTFGYYANFHKTIYLSLYNIQGKKLRRYAFEVNEGWNEQLISLEHLTSGIYLYSIEDGKWNMQGKIVKQ